MSESTLFKFTCKDSMCRAIIPICKTETSVDCSECGIKYDQIDLQDAEPISEYDDYKTHIFRRCVAHLIPKRGAESVKVNGLSNYYCKLLSPLLTNYGLDLATGQAKLLTEMDKGDILDCSIFKDRAFLIDPDQLSIPGFGRDISGSMNYLSVTLKIIKEANEGEERLVPIYTDGDGHCLVHAVSRALVGRELFWHPLRCCLKRHFEMNLFKYQELFKDFMEPEDWRAIIEESDPDFKPPEGELHGLRNVHIFGLANVLKRPIILLDSLECMRKCGDYSALFLPGFVPPEECRGKDGTLNKPICIAWSSFSHNHYIPLVGVQKRPLPVLPQTLMPKVWGMPQSEFHNYIELDSNGNCVIGGSRVLTENYILRLVKAMETLFLEKKGIHPMLVADAKLYLCSEPAYLNVKVEILIENTRLAAERGILYRCQDCKAMTKFHLNPSALGPGGLIYRSLFSKNQDLNANTLYKLPNSGLSFKYDPVKNEFIPDMPATDFHTCLTCGGSKAKRLRPDGSVVDLPREESYSNAGSSLSIQESKSLLNKMFESGNISSQESRALMNKMLKTEPVSSQESKTPVKESDTDSTAKNNSNLLIIDLKWKGKAVQHSISSSEFKELGSSPKDRVSNLALKIAAKHFPNETQNVNFDMYVSDEIWNQISKVPVEKLKSPETSVKEENDEKDNMCEESSSACADASEPQYVKVVSPNGQQANLSLSRGGISYCQLQEWIAAEFKIPTTNQKIKWGFPPKEFEVPTDVNEPNLPLKHGDRLMVENDPLSASQKKNYFNSTPHNSSFDHPSTGDTAELVWSIVKKEPELIKKGGYLFETAAEKLILCDKDHITLPCFPTKRFCFNAATNSLELCVKSLGHFQISADIDERIERVKRGEFAPGFKRCPQMVGPPKEAVVGRPFRKPITPSPEENQHLFRKGPGFSVLSKQSEKMDFT